VTVAAPRTWPDLLDAARGPAAAHEQSLRTVEGLARAGAAGNPLVYLAGADDHLAAVVALRGPDRGRAFADAVEPLVAASIRLLRPAPSPAYALGALRVLSLAQIAASCGRPVTPPGFSPDPWLAALPVPDLDPQDAVTLALLDVAARRLDDVRLLLGEPRAGASPGADPAALARLLAAAVAERAEPAAVEPAWDAFLHGFPAGLAAREAQWRHLLLAAHIVHAVIGAAPPGEVAAALHREIAALAAGPAS
jgi:hypothetical protein